MSAFLIGCKVGPYEITAELGQGGMGVVYLATDSNLGREVALKVLPEVFTRDAERLARFEREAKVLAQLNHPNISHVYGLEVQGDGRSRDRRHSQLVGHGGLGPGSVNRAFPTPQGLRESSK